MKTRNIILSALLAASWATASAVPALPGMHRLTQPDGTVIEAEIIGDEHFHYYVSEHGEYLMSDAKGMIRPMKVDVAGRLRAEGTVTGRPTPAAERARILEAIETERSLAVEKRAARRVSPNPIKQKFPTTGEVTGLVLLVEFEDVAFTPEATKEHYEKICNERNLVSDITTGSVLDYFTAQSSGKFQPKFDVMGPLKLPHKRAYYGAENDYPNFLRDAALAADEAGLDFSKYDVNDDGFVDFLFVVYAGHGEAQGGPAESIWPAMIDLQDYVFDFFDGLNLSVAACSCELKGGSGENLDGVGTICHEFSHILGLADIYDTGNMGGYGMEHFDVMDRGSYNDDQKTPSGYTAMDKWTLGWIEPMTLTEDQNDVRLEAFNESNQAYFIVNPDNKDEYYTLTNRRQQGWDKGIPGSGLVISYVHYVPAYWKRNVVNSPKSVEYEHVHIMAADNVWDSTTKKDEAGDVFPGTSGNTSFSATTAPAAVWKSTKSPCAFAVENIRQLEDGAILFDFKSGTTAVSTVAAEAGVRVEGNDIIAPEGSEVYDLSGRRTGMRGLTTGVYIVRTPEATVKIAL